MMRLLALVLMALPLIGCTGPLIMRHPTTGATMDCGHHVPGWILGDIRRNACLEQARKLGLELVPIPDTVDPPKGK